MSLPLKYHEGEIAVQKQADAFDPAELEANGLGSTFDSRAAAFLAQQPWAVIAALDHEGRVWSSLVHGAPGFLRVDDPTTLSVQSSLPPDDPLTESFGQESEIGMLILDPKTRRRTRINGHAQLTGNKTLVVRTREVYGNCPKYIQRREITHAGSAKVNGAISMSTLNVLHRERIARSDTFFIGSIHAEAGVDCSHRGGNPGFVRALDERRLAFPDYSGNNMFQTLGNLLLDSRAGLLFLDFETGDTLQLTGTATVIWEADRIRDWPGARRVVEFQIHEVIARERASPLRWRLIDYSPFNPT